MVNASIRYLWWIESWDFSSPDFVTLTWSSTLVKFESDLKNISVLIDYWFFQWWRADDENNKIVDDEAIKSDFIVLTHAHLDHCWRIPLLVKSGYSNPIYMTELTALQSYEILLDAVKISRDKINTIKELNKKIETKLREALFVVESIKSLNWKMSSEDREKLKKSLYKKIWNKNYEDARKEYMAILDEEKVYSLDDIKTKIDIVPELLYDESDVESMFKLVHFLDVWEEEVLNDFFYIDKYNKKTLDYILDKIVKWYNWDVVVDSLVFNKIKEKLNQRIDVTKKYLIENESIKKRNQSLAERLDEAITFIKSVDEKDWWELYKSHKSFLSMYKVDDYSDIEDVLEKPYKIKYSIDLLNLLSKSLKVRIKTSDDKNKKIIDSIKLRFLDAWHLEGSIQALITVVSESVNSSLSHKKENWFNRKTSKHTNFLFSWDLWRIKDSNMSWRPWVSELKLDYIQVESTYAWRNHIDKKETTNLFFNALEDAQCKVVIPTFSMQRTQEILMLVLEEMYERRWDWEKLDELKNELENAQNRYDSLENKSWRIAKWLQKTIDLLKIDIKNIKKSIFFTRVILDSPLSQKITNIYLSKLWDKYDLLDPAVQIKLFWREVIGYVRNKDDQKELYTWKRKNRKEVIISSSCMCEWWSVVYHLEQNLSNPKSSVIFVWYAPPNSRWWKIKNRELVSINWENHEVLCNVVDINWFSGHIWEDEILQLLSEMDINRWAKIALTHGWKSRFSLSEKVRTEVLKSRRSIEIVIPDLWSEQTIKI